MLSKSFIEFYISRFLICYVIFFLNVISIIAADVFDPRIKIICTAALITDQYENRKQEYIQGINRIKQFGFMPYVVESCQSGQTFLDGLSDCVWYAQTNDYNLRNKGVNEARALLNFFEHNKFNDDDIIVKLTGRYYFTDDSFLRYIADHIECDAFVKDVAKLYGHKRLDIFFACCALRYKYFVEFLKQLDLEKMEKDKICIEWVLADYITSKKKIKTCLMDKLGLMYRSPFDNNNKYI